MAFLNNVDQLRKFEFARKYLWDIRFPTAPEPFNEFFPAVDIDETKANLELRQFRRFLTEFRVPKKSGIRQLRITFQDDSNNTLVDWLTDWINRLILNRTQDGNMGYVATVDKAVKQVQISKLDSQRQDLTGQVKTYWIIPEGEIVDNRSSSSDAQTYSVNFIILGQVEADREFPDNNP